MSIEQQNDIESLALEISEIKVTLREISQQILRIDRRVRAVLPSPKKTVVNSVSTNCIEMKKAQSIINELTKHARDGQQIEDDLRSMNMKYELSIIARELGMTNKKLPPKHDLVRRISARIRQRVSVETGIQEGVETNSDVIV